MVVGVGENTIMGVVCLKDLRDGDVEGEAWAYAGLERVGSLSKFLPAYVEVRYMLRLKLRLRLPVVGQV